MSDPRKFTIEVKGTAITVVSRKDDDYICLTDIAKHKEPDRADHVIQNWMRNRNTVEFLGVWERLNNADFKPLEFEGFRLKFRQAPTEFLLMLQVLGLKRGFRCLSTRGWSAPVRARVLVSGWGW